MELADINRVGIVGAGTMGHGIAINFALAGYPTMISDLSDEILRQSTGRIRAALDMFVEGQLVTPSAPMKPWRSFSPRAFKDLCDE